MGMLQREYGEFLTGADADILSGSPLERAPGNGVYIVRAASSVNTATLAVKAEHHPEASDARAIQLRANGEILATDRCWIVPVIRGERVTIALAGTTGTVQVQVTFTGQV